MTKFRTLRIGDVLFSGSSQCHDSNDSNDSNDDSNDSGVKDDDFRDLVDTFDHFVTWVWKITCLFLVLRSMNIHDDGWQEFTCSRSSPWVQ